MDILTIYLLLLIYVLFLLSATKALDIAVEKLRQLKFQYINLTFEGVGHFKNEVVFMQIKADGEFQRLCVLSGQHCFFFLRSL